MKASGGKSVYGATVGILMLETRFPRIPGDMGNALTWPFPVLYRVVPKASPERVVRHRAEGLLPAFVEAGRALVREGADGITTNCGFLSLYQGELSAALDVPVATSALMQLPLVERLLPPGRRAGILTISAASLTAEHLEQAGVSPVTPVAGTDGGREFTRAILGDEPELDVELARADNLAAARTLLERNPDLGAIVLECTNMVPYAADIRRATGLPVYSIYSFVTWFQAGLLPRRFEPWLDDTRAN
jgi:Asp/Glu/hydantoin racemase